ncbi:Acetyltransferase (GNAT) domain-containing protein [Phaffia rhodozyma]|uniref:N-alpha-acetyltransferase 40 n=1 Tax=Phaffia rhodozyma TaxID=264483 RepID=A0A0F7SFS1_PHARH|nr:Acetyltransferase (GNAT) domain-containing protein [Phaffia rhodozyma]
MSSEELSASSSASLVASAQKLSTVEILQYISEVSLPSSSQGQHEFKTIVRKAPFLQTEQDEIFSIFSTNMRQLYVNSAFGWNPTSKKKELFHKSSRYAIVREVKSNMMAGYIMFRFDQEERLDDELDPVVYIYELSVNPKFQRSGLGRYLVNAAGEIGKKTNMRKMVLTLLKANAKASTFYESIGFMIDPISPSQFPDHESVDYEILSKTI